MFNLVSLSSTPIAEVEETLNISVHEIVKPVEDVPDSRKEYMLMKVEESSPRVKIFLFCYQIAVAAYVGRL